MMFSLTRASTASWPQTSVNRVLMSSGKYTSTPPRDRNQKMAANWPDGDHEDEHHVGQVAEDADELAGQREQRRDRVFVQAPPRLSTATAAISRTTKTSSSPGNGPNR